MDKLPQHLLKFQWGGTFRGSIVFKAEYAIKFITLMKTGALLQLLHKIKKIIKLSFSFLCFMVQLFKAFYMDNNIAFCTLHAYDFSLPQGQFCPNKLHNLALS